MDSQAPFFSIVIPTRDRPKLLEHALSSLRSQTFTDFEVIVCDNFKNKSSKEMFDKYADSRFRYVKPEQPLSMRDNWEFGVSLTKGKYVGVVIDKTFLFENTLDEAAICIKEELPDFVSWGNAAFVPIDETFEKSSEGQLLIVDEQGDAFEINLQEEIARRCSLDVRMGDEGVKYGWGKVCFGFYSRTLLEKISSRFGRIFFGIAPDQSTSTAALALSQKGIFLNKTLQVSILTTVGNGITGSIDTTVARRFTEESFPDLELLKDYPIPNLWVSVHNVTAYDWLLAAKHFGYSLNQQNLTKRVSEDLAKIKLWKNLEERLEQFALLWNAEQNWGVWQDKGGKFGY